jgi:CelD/BcsL family acetyltransferase involved in cellulose biosynthesis
MFTARPAADSSAGITVAFEPSLDRASWSDLAARVAPPLRFLAHGWWQAWADATLPTGNWRGPLRLAVARDPDGVVLAVLPCAEQVMLGLSVLSLAGNYKPFRSWLIAADAPPETASSIARFLARDADARAFRMGPVETSRPEIQILKRALDDAGWLFCRINHAADHLIDLPADLEAYAAMLPARKFKRIRAKKNRLKKLGEVRIVCHRDLDPAGWTQAIEEAGRVERSSWFSRLDADLTYADPKMAAFWQRYLSDPEASRGTSLWTLYLEDRPIAYTVMLHVGTCSYGLTGAYDEEFRDYSPGKMIDAEAITVCLEQGIEVIHLGQGDSGYKADWGANRQEPLDDWIAFPPSAAGRLLHLAARAKFGPPPS